MGFCSATRRVLWRSRWCHWRCTRSVRHSGPWAWCPVTWGAEPLAPDEQAIETMDAEEPITDPCGCTSKSSPQVPADAGPPAGETCQSGQGHAWTGRAVKLVALVRSTDTGYQAQLAAGAEGCDPELRVVDVPDLPSALAVLPEVLAAAEARWQQRPRYPAVTGAPASPHAPRPAGAPASSPARARTDRAHEPAAAHAVPAVPAPPAPPAQPGGEQLSLFC
jgi:hypothetical protein